MSALYLFYITWAQPRRNRRPSIRDILLQRIPRSKSTTIGLQQTAGLLSSLHIFSLHTNAQMNLISASNGNKTTCRLNRAKVSTKRCVAARVRRAAGPWTILRKRNEDASSNRCASKSAYSCSVLALCRPAGCGPGALWQSCSLLQHILRLIHEHLQSVF